MWKSINNNEIDIKEIKNELPNTELTDYKFNSVNEKLDDIKISFDNRMDRIEDLIHECILKK